MAFLPELVRIEEDFVQLRQHPPIGRARPPSGHAAEPPSSIMNSRRCIQIM
jgi:hypothetical protein